MAALPRFATGIGRRGTTALATPAADCGVMPLMHGPEPARTLTDHGKASVFHSCRGPCRFISGVSEVPGGMLQEVLQTVGPALSSFLRCR